MADDLLARLRKVEPDAPGERTRWYRNPDGPEAADEIERLRAALELFACKCGPYRCAIHGDDAANYDKCAAMIARATLAGEKKDDLV